MKGMSPYAVTLTQYRYGECHLLT